MKKRYVTEYGGIILVTMGLLFAYLKLWWLFALIMVAWYFLFGFVGLAFTTSTMRKLNLSNVLLLITVPTALVPFRRAFYYWTKAVNTTLSSPNNIEAIDKALELANKVKPDSLYTDNNKAMFFSFLAALHFDSDNKEVGKTYLDKAISLPHKPQLDSELDKLKSHFINATAEVNVIGVYSLPETNTMHLIELQISIPPRNIDVSSFQQKDEDLPKSDWQTAFNEQYLDESGVSVIGGFEDAMNIDDNKTRLVFFLYYVDFSKPLLSQFGSIILPSPAPIPERLQKTLDFNEVD